jgi:DNA-binding NarL/FixJ family response regulator
MNHLLTSRELEVLSLMAKGYSNKEIAEELFITEATVITHIRHLYQKLEITEYTGHGGATFRVRAVLKFFELQKQGVI